MKKMVLLAALVAALAPVAAQARTPNGASTAAGQVCAALRSSMGATFAHAYPTFGACASAYAGLDQANLAAATASCTAEQADVTFAAAHGGKTFAQFYATGKSGRDAFARCVSLKARAAAHAESQSPLNPARTCRAARTTIGAAAFGMLYGKNANDRNAFGKCVSSVAHLQASTVQSAAGACRAEQANAGFAAAHGDKTFDAFYGTNADRSNAFGKCVSQKAHAAATARQQAITAAATACRAEQVAGATAFTQKYGTFGRCVSLKARGH
ncbi:MAG: hypothetical protein V7644_1952 [Actinomycetota bacterium]|jgi:hypothetical protein